MTEPLPIVVRPCFEMDLIYVQLIYAHHVLTGTGTFETTPPDVHEMRARWMHIAAREWPYIVACAEGDPTRIHGFAYATPFRERDGYAQTFEDSIYVAPHALRRGVGKTLLAHMLAELDAMNAREVIAAIGDSANVASIELHARMGFRRVGLLADIGVKFGRSLDLVLMQRTMSAGAAAKSA